MLSSDIPRNSLFFVPVGRESDTIANEKCAIGLSYNLLTIEQADGTQTEQCVSSFPFTEVVARASASESVLFDIYAEEETLTNKVFMGKPVYRKVIKFPRSVGDKTINHNIPDYDDLWITHFSSVHDGGSIEATSYYAGNSTDNFIRVRPGTMTYYGRTDVWTKVSAVLEYTKVNDEPVELNVPTKTYLNDVASDTGLPVVLDVADISVKSTANYAYDTTTASCVAL